MSAPANLDIKIEPLLLPNVTPIVLDLPAPVVQYLNDLVETIQNQSDQRQPHNANLAGHLAEEYQMAFNQDFCNLLTSIGQQFYVMNSLPTRPLILTSSWVNFQRRYEFNPTHNHDGLLSFVIWLRIPYDLAEEMQVFPRARGGRTSKFEFVYTSIMGHPHTRELDVDKSWEGRMCMFPSALSHAVYPFFTSDGVRISISGNLAQAPG